MSPICGFGFCRDEACFVFKLSFGKDVKESGRF